MVWHKLIIVLKTVHHGSVTHGNAILITCPW